jgi:flagellar biosynthetic protein FlhB
MAEERTEQATPRKREEVRRRGEVARSVELAGAASLVGALVALRIGWSGVGQGAVEAVRWCLSECLHWEPTVQSASELIRAGLRYGLRLAAPAAVGACAVAVAINLGQSGFLISPRPLAFQWSRVSLTQGIRRIFSVRGLFALLRSLVKLGAVALVTFLYLRARWPVVLGLAQQRAAAGAAGMAGLLWGLLIRVAGVLLVVALADYVFQRHEFQKNLRMTRHEVREEHRRTEGDPLTRSRIRERQRAAARQRMMEAVKRANVVVTNPVEIAVALRYAAAEMPAPMVVAKGRRLMAERIRAEAERHGVPITRQPDLARALYRSVPVGWQIPPELYQAVAEILAFVHRLTGRAVR